MTPPGIAPMTDFEGIWQTPDLPFTIGVRNEPINGHGIPDTMPFELGIDLCTSVVVQRPAAEVMNALSRAYAIGSLLGTAMDDTPLGHCYAEDFVAYLSRLRPVTGLKILEIGAGRGFLLKILQDAGAQVLGVEPGVASRPHWARHGVRVVAKPFPCEEATGPFDLVLAYALIEHIPDLATFLSEVQRALAPGGTLVVSVPDCTAHIATGDPSMLLHEHFSYFTRSSLRNAMAAYGWGTADISLSGYGGAIYGAFRPDSSVRSQRADADALGEARGLGKSFEALIASVSFRVEELQRKRQSLGIYCPARGLAILPKLAVYRFFDDDPDLQGQYYPPFKTPVESREALLANPVDELWILSRTFGTKLASELSNRLPATTIRLPHDLVPAPLASRT